MRQRESVSVNNSFYNDSMFLRVTRPQTTDGINPLYDDHRQPVMTVTELPFSAKQMLEKENEKTPNQLKLKIEVIHNS